MLKKITTTISLLMLASCYDNSSIEKAYANANSRYTNAPVYQCPSIKCHITKKLEFKEKISFNLIKNNFIRLSDHQWMRTHDVEWFNFIIEVYSDPNATYTIVNNIKMINGNFNVITKRKGPSGVSFTRREIDCDHRQFRYISTGDNIESMSKIKFIDQMSPLTYGSISSEIAESICT